MRHSPPFKRARRRGRAAFLTNYYGLALLDAWAAKNKRFAGYLQAYLPKKVRETLTIEAMMAKQGQK